MGLFGLQNPLKAPEGWELMMTEEEVIDMEKQGYDVTEIRAKRAAATAKEDAKDEAFAERRKQTAVAIDLGRLTPYRATPRSTDTDFFAAVAGKAPLLGKDKWRAKVANAPLVYGAVVQANSDLWLPGNEAYLPAVLVFALDAAHMYDTAFLTELAEKISEMKNSSSVPPDCHEFINILRDDASQFCFPVGASIAGGAEAWCVTYQFEKQEVLPGKRLPEDGIVPMLLDEKPKKQIPIQLRVIPGKLYQA